jgi:predicted hydrocarbon binding protein
MDPIPKSGHFLPKRFARFTLFALEELLEEEGMQGLLEVAHLSELSDNYPAASLESAFDFSDFSALMLGLEDLYGARGGRGFALRAGRAAFAKGLKDFGALTGGTNKALALLPMSGRIKIGLPFMTKVFNSISDQRSRYEQSEQGYEYIIHRNPACWGRSGADKAVCYFQVGLLEEAMKHISGGREFRVDEAECKAAGDDVCRFIIQKEPIE